MGEHTNPGEPVLTQIEPAAVTEGTRWLLGALVTLGWFTLDNYTINAITTAVGALASAVLTLWARRRVTPTPRS